MSTQLTQIDSFKQQMSSTQVQSTLREFLPNDVMMKRFTAVTIRVVQEKPELLDADRKSLFLACQRAAQDGLMPDGRESAMVVYNTNVGTRDQPKWEKKIQYQPMIQGIRKRLAKAGWSMAAEIVYKNDVFSYELGDNPLIVHRPKLDGARGPMVGAYAIATFLETGEKYREYMAAEQLEKVRAASKNSNGGAWAAFPDEMHRKTPAKRLLKYLPLDEDDIFDMISRDNEQFDFADKAGPSETAQNVQAAVRAASKAPEPPEPPAETERSEPSGRSEAVEGELLEDEKPKKRTLRKAAPEPGPEPDESEGDDTDPLGF